MPYVRRGLTRLAGCWWKRSVSEDNTDCLARALADRCDESRSSIAIADSSEAPRNEGPARFLCLQSRSVQVINRMGLSGLCSLRVFVPLGNVKASNGCYVDPVGGALLFCPAPTI